MTKNSWQRDRRSCWSSCDSWRLGIIVCLSFHVRMNVRKWNVSERTPSRQLGTAGMIVLRYFGRQVSAANRHTSSQFAIGNAPQVDRAFKRDAGANCAFRLDLGSILQIPHYTFMDVQAMTLLVAHSCEWREAQTWHSFRSYILTSSHWVRKR